MITHIYDADVNPFGIPGGRIFKVIRAEYNKDGSGQQVNDGNGVFRQIPPPEVVAAVRRVVLPYVDKLYGEDDQYAKSQVPVEIMHWR
jgi:hypothetical protein